jgi:hypothetical protein
MYLRENPGMPKNDDWRAPRPVYEDDRLEPVDRLVKQYRNMWQDADFDDRLDDAARYETLYRYYKKQLDEGNNYAPKF